MPDLAALPLEVRTALPFSALQFKGGTLWITPLLLLCALGSSLKPACFAVSHRVLHEILIYVSAAGARKRGVKAASRRSNTTPARVAVSCFVPLCTCAFCKSKLFVFSYTDNALWHPITFVSPAARLKSTLGICRSFWRAVAAGEELDYEALYKLLKVFSAGEAFSWLEYLLQAVVQYSCSPQCSQRLLAPGFRAAICGHRGCAAESMLSHCLQQLNNKFPALLCRYKTWVLNKPYIASLKVLREGLLCCAVADGQGGRAALAACTARRWLARNAGGVKLVCTGDCMEVPAWISLVSCLPALQDVTFSLNAPLVRDDLGCLLEALAWCPQLRALDLCTLHEGIRYAADEDLHWPFPDAAAFAKLRSLKKLALFFEDKHFCLADIVNALMPLTGLAELRLELRQPGVMPAALGHLKGLRSLTLSGFSPCILQAGCLDLPNLLSLAFEGCGFGEDAHVLPDVTALQCVTRIESTGTKGPCFFDPQLVHLPHLQRLVLTQHCAGYIDISPGLPRLPIGMGSLSSSLLHLDISAFALSHFPLAFTQLVALEFLDASSNQFADLPAGITAISRLTKLALGRCPNIRGLQLPEQQPLDVRALGDLSGFPALRELAFDFCEVMLCPSLLGAVRHASLTVMFIHYAHPAPESAQMVLQLSQELRRSSCGSLLAVVSVQGCVDSICMPREQVRFASFKAALQSCGQ